MAYINADDIRTTQLAGQYRDAGFPIPRDTMLSAMRAPAAAASIAKAASTLSGPRRSSGMRGGYMPATWSTPPYRNAAGMGMTFDTSGLGPWWDSLPAWQQGAIITGSAIALITLMTKRGRR